MINNIIALYFSPTRTTKRVVCAIAAETAKILGLPFSEIDITTPAQREKAISFTENDLVIFGAPVYIGRMPNLISPFFKTINGNGALGIPVAVYGNRAYDDGLIELRDIMAEDRFRLIAAAAFVGEHTFSYILGGGRPDTKDLEIAKKFAAKIAEKVRSIDNSPEEPDTIGVPGTSFPYSGFYKATDTDKKSVDIRKVLPKTDVTKCTQCGECARICSMGAISISDCQEITGKCIKCGACIKRCPQGAKYFDDPQYLSHLKLLEDKFSGKRCEPELFIN
ncbi:MAG: EFR1 family ferrodoxin [Bacteroidales bacterium]|nr:EFR1 family ferrodoxin [Bacteroidales bacterium]